MTSLSLFTSCIGEGNGNPLQCSCLENPRACRAVAPIVEELAEEYADKVNIGKCDVEECDDISANYRVRNVPTLVFIKGGEVVDKHVGAINKADLKAKIDALL